MDVSGFSDDVPIVIAPERSNESENPSINACFAIISSIRNLESKKIL